MKGGVFFVHCPYDADAMAKNASDNVDCLIVKNIPAFYGECQSGHKICVRTFKNGALAFRTNETAAT